MSYTKHKTFILLFIPILILFIIQGCKRPSHSDIGKLLNDKSKNKIYKQLTTEGYTTAVKQMLQSKKVSLTNPDIIKSYYAGVDYEPVLIRDHFVNGDLDTAVAILSRSSAHGLNPKLFNGDEMANILTKLRDPKAIKTVDEAYENMARLELMMANALVNYSNDMQFGVVNPHKIYQRYYTKTLRPDSTSMKKVFAAQDLKAYLDSIQPHSPQYVALQKALTTGYTAPGLTQEETKRILLVNMERMRWKDKPTEARFVQVNIPAFQLDVMDQGHSTLNMKVCVGEGRNKDFNKSLVRYDDTDVVDHPIRRETPQLTSLINEAQVNPVWNIPVSIASREIIVEADKDPYYLSNKNINVYRNGKLVDDPEDIDWNDPKVAEEYSFKQQPGEENSLGKIKFLFPNKSSVYLHDTPAKNAFNFNKRDVSHGCVRLEKPIDLAHALFGEGEKFNLIEKYVGEDNPKTIDIALPKKVPVYITYVTCWADDTGALQFRPDVYGLDIVLYGNLQKKMLI